MAAAHPQRCATCDGWPGRWPDPLLPNRPIDLAANTTQPVWITVTVPKGAPAGDYTGAVRLVAGQERCVAATVYGPRLGFPSAGRTKHMTAKFDVGPGPGAKWWGQPWEKARPRDHCHDGQAAAVPGAGRAAARVQV